MKSNFEALPYVDSLLRKVFAFYSTIWIDKRIDGVHKNWIENFVNADGPQQSKERVNAIYLLTKFMYFGNLELRELLKCVYRDLFRYEIIKRIRKENGDTLDSVLLESKFQEELAKTRFLGVGNPSESGVHMLYYFRQENLLPKDYFINTHEIFKQIEEERTIDSCIEKYLRADLANPKIKRYVFIDDFCVSGTQAKSYSREIIDSLKKLDPTIEANYFMLFATEAGKNEVVKKTKFDLVKSIYTIDDSFKCFSPDSRYYVNGLNGEIDQAYFKEACARYGKALWPSHPLGYEDGQLLLGMFHNTPDNTLPIFWSDSNKWVPIFKRYPKI